MFGKHFESLYTGSMFGKPALWFAVWGYCIAYQRPDREGVHYVELNPLLLGPMFSSDPAEVCAVIEALCSPDPASRTPDEEGRRLVREHGPANGPATYRVVNGAKYRAIRDEEARREQVRQAVRRHRNKAVNSGNQRKPAKATESPSQKAEAESEERGQRESEPPTPFSDSALIGDCLAVWGELTGAVSFPVGGTFRVAGVLPALCARVEPGGVVALWRHHLTAWLAEKGGKRVQLRWFCEDLPDRLAEPRP